METDREKHGLKGAVKSVLVETARFEEQGGQMTEKPWFSQTMNFNQYGGLAEQRSSNSDGWELRIVSDYSDSGKLLATRSYDYSGALVNETRFIYDDEERLVAEQLITRDGEVTTPISYVYDAGGAKIKIQELDSFEDSDLMIGIEGTMSTINANGAKRMETRYDDQDKPVEVKLFNTAGSLVSRMEITRDERGNPLEETQYQGDEVRFGPGSCSTEEIESLTAEQKAEFAAVVEQMFSPGSVISKHTHTYDVEGRLVESTLTMMGMVVNRQTFAYDEAGNKSEEVSYNDYAPGGGKSIFTREYDEHGNWTKELVSTVSSWDAEFGLSTPAHVTRRTITYYT